MQRHTVKLMVHRTWRTNPWSVPLVVAGLAFTLTASAYAVMAVRKLDAGRGWQDAEPSPRLIEFLDQHGEALMAAELAALAIAAIAAMESDRRPFRKRTPKPEHHSEEDTSQPCSDQRAGDMNPPARSVEMPGDRGASR